MLPDKIVESLENLVGAENLIIENEALRTYKQDGLSGFSGDPSAVALPGNEKEVVGVLKICNKYPLIKS